MVDYYEIVATSSIDNAFRLTETNSSVCYTPHPLRVQRKRTKGARLPEGAFCVTRPGPWGNPFKVDSCIEAGFARTREEAGRMCVECFADWLLKGDLSDWWNESSREKWQYMRDNLWRLKGKRLACFCPLDRPCHADILATFAARL